MRPFDVDQQQVRVRPVAQPGPSGPPRPVAHGLRAFLLLGGRLLEGGAVAAAGPAAAVLGGGESPSALAVAVVALAAAQVLSAAGLYEAETGYGRPRATILSFVLVLVVVPPVALAAGQAPALGWGLLAAGGIAALRPLYALLLRRLARWSQAARRVLVVGDRDHALEALSHIAGDERRWAFPVGVCLDRDAPPRPILGGFITGLEDAERLTRDEGVDDIILALPWSDTARLRACLDVLKPLNVDVHLFPDSPQPFASGRGLSVLAGVPMAKLGARPLAGWSALAKAVEDRVLGGILLALLAPVFAVIAIAIKLDSPGPVFFRQARYGFDNRPFMCLKFRTMHHRPPEGDTPEAGTPQATRNDPRVTKVGRFLRKSSLDELAQLLNVVGGSMSLVGPRPHAVAHHHHYARLVDDYRCRHRMKPGITGWAQINGYRGETATIDLMRKRVIHDLWYIDNWSLGLDLLILARTPIACLRATNAY